jgi:hypothetical protein
MSVLLNPHIFVMLVKLLKWDYWASTGSYPTIFCKTFMECLGIFIWLPYFILLYTQCVWKMHFETKLVAIDFWRGSITKHPFSGYHIVGFIYMVVNIIFYLVSMNANAMAQRFRLHKNIDVFMEKTYSLNLIWCLL